MTRGKEREILERDEVNKMQAAFHFYNFIFELCVDDVDCMRSYSEHNIPGPEPGLPG